MNSGLYAACAGLLAQMQSLELAAANLANVNTTGYRGQRASFHSVLAQESAASPVDEAVNNFGVLGDSQVDTAQGTLEPTGSDLDFAIQGSGWFAVEVNGTRLLTRNGNFHVARDGRLVTSNGNPVLGAQGPITVPPGKLSVSGDGTLSVDGALAGQLQLFSLPAGSSPLAVGGSYFSAEGAAPQKGGGGGSILQGSLESSNVNGITAAVGLVSLQRRYDLLQQALTVFHTDFNRIAAQDLPRL